MEIFSVILIGSLSGLLGAFGMNLFLRWVSASFDEPVNMVKVLGSFITRGEGSNTLVGTGTHLTFGAIFGVIYVALLSQIFDQMLPASFFTGLGFGFMHGLLNSYIMMFIMGEYHPVEKYRRSTFSIGVLYLLAHIIFGGITGLISGFLFLL